MSHEEADGSSTAARLCCGRRPSCPWSNAVWRLAPRFPAISGGAGSFSRANDGACLRLQGQGLDGHSSC